MYCLTVSSVINSNHKFNHSIGSKLRIVRSTKLQIFSAVLFCLLFAQTASALSVVATIPVGSTSVNLVYDSIKGKTFVTNNGGNTVSVINDTTNTVVATVPVGSAPNGAGYAFADGEIFVANFASNSISVINDATNTVVATITDPSISGPVGVAYDSNQNEIFVTNFSSNTVVVINAGNNLLVGSPISVGSLPYGITYDSAKGEIFVINNGGNTVSVINDVSNTVVATVPVGSSPRGLSYDTNIHEIFVTNQGSNTVSVISDSTNTVVATVPVGNAPFGVAYHLSNGEIFVANNGDGTVSVINDATNTVVATVPVGSDPLGVAYDSGKNEIFVANGVDNTVSVISGLAPSSPSSSTGGHDVSVYNPPSLGNDYHFKYGSGVSINGKPFDIKTYHSVIPQQVLPIYKQAVFNFTIYDERGGNTVSHVGLYLHFKGNVAASNADTWISWDKRYGVQIHDPNKIFSSANVTTTTDTNYRYATFTLTPQKTMPDSSLVMRMWDDKLASGDIPIWGAIIIVDPNAPVPVQKIPDNQYGDYATLQNILDKDGYIVPSLLHKQYQMQISYSSVDINWVYDKGTDKLTMIESDKSGNVMGDVVYNLFKKTDQPTITDHDYAYIPTQLNRNDVQTEQAAMQTEAVKAQKDLTNISYLDSTAPSLVSSGDAIPILGSYENSKTTQLYQYDHSGENTAMKTEAEKAEKLAESLGLLRQNNFESLLK